MATSRNIHATTISNPALKNSKPSKKFHFSTAKLLVANAVLVVGIAGSIDLHNYLEKQREPEPERKHTATLSLSNTFTVTRTERTSIHNSLKTLPSGNSNSKSLALVVDAGKKVLENEPRILSGEGYSPMLDEFIELYGKAGGEMIDSAIARSKELPETKREAFLAEAYPGIVAFLLRPYAAWEGPTVLKELDQLISSPEFSQDSLDKFAEGNNLMKEYFEITMNVGNRFYF